MEMELVGNVYVRCPKTGLAVSLDFKPKPFVGGDYNYFCGDVTLHKKKIYSISGHWNQKIYLKDVQDTNKNSKGQLLWEVTKETTMKRALKYKVTSRCNKTQLS